MNLLIALGTMLFLFLLILYLRFMLWIILSPDQALVFAFAFAFAGGTKWLGAPNELLQWSTSLGTPLCRNLLCYLRFPTH